MEQKDSAFVQFETMAYGYRAAWKALESYWKHFHTTQQSFSVSTIITRWAPPNENNTKSYIHTVLRLSGLGGKENLPQPSRGIRPRLPRQAFACKNTAARRRTRPRGDGGTADVG